IPAPGGFMCSNCLRSQKQMPRRTFCIYRYVYPVSRLIQDMKFHSRLDIADFLGRKLAHLALSGSAEIPQCLIPVPLHSSRLRERGFNQAQELARVISDVSGIPVDNNMVERVYKTAAQSGLSALQRGRNIRGAFKSSHNMQSQYSHVAIIDDVVT